MLYILASYVVDTSDCFFFSDTIYDKIQREHQISRGDFPDIKRMQVPTNT